MRLILDEMYSQTIASKLRNRGIDAISVHERPALEGRPDGEVLEAATLEGRVVVTNNVRDFAPLVETFGLRGQMHLGALFTDDATFPRTRDGTVPLVEALAAFAAGRPDDDMVDGCQFLPLS